MTKKPVRRKKQKPPVVHPNMAQVDENGVLLGYSDKEGAKGIPVPHNCDLVPGKYYWNGKKTWLPVDDPRKMDAPAPNVMRAIALGFRAVQESGVKLPDETVDWLDFFEKSVDNIGGKS